MALVHGGLAVMALMGQFPDSMKSSGVVPDDYTFSMLEEHLLEAIGIGVHGMMCWVEALATLREDSHFRGIVMLMETHLFGVIFYCDYKREITAVTSGALFAIGLLGTVVHAMEPGLFTKDKKAKSS